MICKSVLCGYKHFLYLLSQCCNIYYLSLRLTLLFLREIKVYYLSCIYIVIQHKDIFIVGNDDEIIRISKLYWRTISSVPQENYYTKQLLLHPKPLPRCIPWENYCCTLLLYSLQMKHCQSKISFWAFLTFTINSRAFVLSSQMRQEEMMMEWSHLEQVLCLPI